MVAYAPGQGDPQRHRPDRPAEQPPGLPDPDLSRPAGDPGGHPRRRAARRSCSWPTTIAARPATIASLFQKYRDAGRPVEAHIFARGGHGFNMGNRSKLESVKKWPERLADWMDDSGILDPPNDPRTASH